MATHDSVEAVKRTNVETGGATVSVASKLPFDIVARLFDFTEKNDPVMGGGFRKYRIAVERFGVPTFTFLGNSFAQNDSNHQEIVCGFGVTRDIPKAFWDEWLEQNKDADYVRNGLVFAHSKTDSLKAEASEKEGIVTNLERLDPSRLPSGLMTADETRRAA